MKILSTSPREPLHDRTGNISPRWQRWLDQLQIMLGSLNGTSWKVIDKSDSSLADIGTREHGQLQKIYGADASNSGVIIEDPAYVKHVSDEQAERWDSMTSATGDDQALQWM